jgi:ATP-dependent helicase/nuclease subunit A
VTAPVDQEIRDAASHDIRTSFFLEAGAGTGKTRILVDRALEIVRTGAADIQDVVVITFTEKAAGELRSRIREKLHERSVGAVEDERRRYRRALSSLDSAHIETIHAFASSLIREHPLEAQVDPNFHQLDEVGNELDFQERWNDWIWSIEGNELAAVERCLTLGMSLATVREVARILERLRELSLSEMRATAPDASDVLANLMETLGRCEGLTEYCQDERDNCLRSYEELHRQVVAASGLEGPALERALLAIRFRLQRGNAGHWHPKERRDEVYELLADAQEELQTYREALNEEALGALAKALAGFVQGAAQARKREGKLNFEDLLIEARALVREQPSVRRILQERFRFILVDEFQDTDPLQAELVFLLSADEEREALGAPADWTGVTLSPGKLFLVGDPKQSIYRFRRADIDTYSAAKRVFRRHQETGEPARLETILQNFRSVPQLTEWVNSTFAQVLRSNPGYPSAQPEYSEIQSYRQGTPGPGVVLLYPSVNVGDYRMGELRQAESESVARLITSLVDNEQWVISDPDEERREQPRKISFRDICLLVDTRTQIDLYTDALTSQNVPFILDGGREFFQRQEVRDLAAILRALDDPSDEVSLVAALKSEAFSCSDVELLEHRRAGGRFSIFLRDGEDRPVGRAIARLRTLYNAKARLSLPAFVDRVIRQSFLVESLLVGRGDRQRAANLKVIVERAVEFAANEVDSLRPFIRWLSERQMEGAQERESQLSETDDDVVRIMTIHGAKGLEFPVVILAKLSSGDWGGREKRVVDREQGVLDFEVGKQDNRFRTPGFAGASARETVYERAQDARLMYVATTRARDLLVVPVYRSDRYAGKFEYLPGLPSQASVARRDRSAEPEGTRVMLDQEIRARTLPADFGPAFPEDISRKWHERAKRREELKAAGPRFVVPSQLGADEVKEPRETEPKDRNEEEKDLDVQDEAERALGVGEGAAGLAFVGSSSARRRGSLVHEVLYRCELADPDSATQWARRLCFERGLPELTEEVERHARAILDSSAIQRVRAARQIMREVPVASFDESTSTYVEGFVDLAFEEDDGWVIVDYKTDRVDGNGAKLVERYRPQLEAYRGALSAAGMAVKQSALWFSDTGNLHVL